MSNHAAPSRDEYAIAEAAAALELDEAEIYFLIAKFLDSGPCSATAFTLRQEAASKGLMPSTMTWEGVPRPTSYEAAAAAHAHVPDDHLVQLLRAAVARAHAVRAVPLSGFSSLLAAPPLSFATSRQAAAVAAASNDVDAAWGRALLAGARALQTHTTMPRVEVAERWMPPPQARQGLGSGRSRLHGAGPGLGSLADPRFGTRRSGRIAAASASANHGQRGLPGSGAEAANARATAPATFEVAGGRDLGERDDSAPNPPQEPLAEPSVMHTLLHREISTSARPAGFERSTTLSATRYVKGASVLGHLASVYCAIFDKTGRRVITGADDALIKVWSVATGYVLHTLRGHQDVIVELDVSPDNALLASGSNDHTVRIWELDTGIQIAVFRAHDEPVTGVRFAPGALPVVEAVEKPKGRGGRDDDDFGAAAAAAVAQAEAVAVAYAAALAEPGRLPGVGDVTDMDVSAQEGEAAAASGTAALGAPEMWPSLAAMSPATTPPPPAAAAAAAAAAPAADTVPEMRQSPAVPVHPPPSMMPPLLPRSPVAATAGRPGEPEPMLLPGSPPLMVNPNPPQALPAASPVRANAANPNASEVEIPLRVSQTVCTMTVLSISTDGKAFLRDPYAYDKPARLLSIHEGLGEIGPHHRLMCCAFNASGDRVAVGSHAGTVFVWDTETGSLLTRLDTRGPTKPPITTVSWGHTVGSGDWIVGGCDDGLARIWRPRPGTGALGGDDGAVATGEDGDGFEQRLRLGRRRSRRRGGNGGGDTLRGPRWGMVRLVPRELENVGSQRRPRYILDAKVTMVAVTCDDKAVVTANTDHELVVFALPSGQRLRSLTKHTDSVFVLDPHPTNPRLLLSAGYDGEVAIWDLAAGVALASFALPGVQVLDGRWDPTAASFTVSTNDGQLHVFTTMPSGRYAGLPLDHFTLRDYAELAYDDQGFAVDADYDMAPCRLPMLSICDRERNVYEVQPDRSARTGDPVALDRSEVEAIVEESLEARAASATLRSDAEAAAMAGRAATFGGLPHDYWSDGGAPGDETSSDCSWDGRGDAPAAPRTGTGRRRGRPRGSRNNATRRSARARNVVSYRELDGETSDHDSDFVPQSSEESPSVADFDDDSQEGGARGRRRSQRRRRRARAVFDSSSGSVDSGVDLVVNDDGTVNQVRRSARQRQREREERQRGRETRKRRRDEEASRMYGSGGGSGSRTRARKRRRGADDGDDDEDEALARALAESAAEAAAAVASGGTSAAAPRKPSRRRGPHPLGLPLDFPAWMRATEPGLSYVPQLGDEVVYFRQGHEAFARRYPDRRLEPEPLPWETRPSLAASLVCRVVSVEWIVAVPQFASVTLQVLRAYDADETGHGRGAGVAPVERITRSALRNHLTFTYEPSDEADFMVLTARLAASPVIVGGERVGVYFQDQDAISWGVAVERSPVDENRFPTSVWEDVLVAWDEESAISRVGFWELVPEGDGGEDGGQARPGPEQLTGGARLDDVLATRLANGIEAYAEERDYVVAFAGPVDVSLYRNYPAMIPYPMDLTTLAARLRGGYYRTTDALLADVGRIADNAALYNLDGSPVVLAGRRLRVELTAFVASDGLEPVPEIWGDDWAAAVEEASDAEEVGSGGEGAGDVVGVPGEPTAVESGAHVADTGHPESVLPEASAVADTDAVAVGMEGLSGPAVGADYNGVDATQGGFSLEQPPGGGGA